MYNILVLLITANLLKKPQQELKGFFKLCVYSFRRVKYKFLNQINTKMFYQVVDGGPSAHFAAVPWGSEGM